MKRVLLLFMFVSVMFVMFSQIEAPVVVEDVSTEVVKTIPTESVTIEPLTAENEDCGLCLEYYILAIVGMGVHLALKWRDAMTQSEAWNWKTHLIYSGIGVLTSFVIIYLREYLTIDIAGTEISVNPLTAFFIGYFADSVWKNIEGSMRKKLKTE